MTPTGDWVGPQSVQARALRRALDAFRLGDMDEAARLAQSEPGMSAPAVAVSLAATAAHAAGITADTVARGFVVGAKGTNAPTGDEVAMIAHVGAFLGVVIGEGPDAGVDAFIDLSYEDQALLLSGLMSMMAAVLDEEDARDN
jgi:hypothetical protein